LTMDKAGTNNDKQLAFLSGRGTGTHLKRLHLSNQVPRSVPPPSNLLSRLDAFLPKLAEANASLSPSSLAQANELVELVDKDQDESPNDDLNQQVGKVEMNLALVERGNSSSDGDDDAEDEGTSRCLPPLLFKITELD